MFPEPISWLGMENKSTHSPIKRNVLQHKINTKKLQPGLVTSYDIGLEREKAYSGFGAS